MTLAGMSPLWLLDVDSFCKYYYVVPVDRKPSSHWVKAFKRIFEAMGNPKVIYTDPDSSMMATNVERFLKTEGIEWIRALEHSE
jgi:hypothetical protein